MELDDVEFGESVSDLERISQIDNKMSVEQRSSGLDDIRKCWTKFIVRKENISTTTHLNTYMCPKRSFTVIASRDRRTGLRPLVR